MPSVTIDECLEKVGNRFQLVVIAARRARQLAMGDTPRVETEGSKPTVAALKEIGLGAITPDEIREINITTPINPEPLHPILDSILASENN
ncbi:hypothetical protein AwWohl_12240 [Gammaproteobacteria bacterium]|nr:hypothetical protein AwWohl_12240 [Gammaproteobacteria bacterium]